MPPDKRSGPRTQTKAAESLIATTDTSSVHVATDSGSDATPSAATREFLATLADCSGPDDPTFRAASLLADAWQPALARSYRQGYEDGYAAGFWEAERDMADAWAKAAKPIRDVLAQPTYTEVQALRGEADDAS